jgi:hypothetical protein
VDRNKRKAALYARGVLARRQEREGRDKIKALEATGQTVPLELTVPIRDPEKNPTPEDLESLEPHPSVAQLAIELYTEEITIPQIDLELLAESQPVNYLPGSPGEEGRSPREGRSPGQGNINGQEEEGDD